MLNELYDLSQRLEDAQVSMASWHRHFKPCPAGTPTYLVLLDAKSCVVELEPITDRERISAIRKWKVENGVSFPGFNVLPLFEPHDDEGKKQAVELKKALVSKTPPSRNEIQEKIETLVGNSDSLWVNKEAARIEKCVTTHAKSLAADLGSPPKEYDALVELISRASRLTAGTIHNQIQGLLVRGITASPVTAKNWFDVLFFHSGKSPKKVSLIVELADRSRFRYPANHEAVQVWMNSQLQLMSEPQSSNSGSSVAVRSDAFANPAVRLGVKFPSVRLPVLGNVVLRAMLSEIPCQRRYGFADSDSCPVGQSTRQEMKNSLEWIGDADRQSKTWSDVSSLTGKASVLFAYPSRKPEAAPELAGLIAGIDLDTDPDGARFETCAARVTRALKAQAGDDSSGDIYVFVLMKADKARTKVLHSRRFTARYLVGSADEWHYGARNIPTVKIRQFGQKKGDRAYWDDPFIPYPAEVVKCLNTAWERAGTHAEQVPGFDIGDGLELLLEGGVRLRTVAERSIRTLLANSRSLLLALGQAHHQNRVHPVGKKYAKYPLLLPGVLGLLLAKLNRWKGDYMKGPPFLVGRLLSLADQLHAQYCMGVRKGQVPPQLVGNTLMATALEQPEKALALLCQRILPYQAWASTVQEGENIGLTKYLLGQLGRVCTELKELELPRTCKDTDKAEMLLGYLARSEKDKDTVTTSSTTREGAKA